MRQVASGPVRMELVKFPRAPDAGSKHPVTCQREVQLAVMEHQTLGAVRPVQHNVHPVTPFSVENGWPTFGLRG